jgi:hypothetical protein
MTAPLSEESASGTRIPLLYRTIAYVAGASLPVSVRARRVCKSPVGKRWRLACVRSCCRHLCDPCIFLFQIKSRSLNRISVRGAGDLTGVQRRRLPGAAAPTLRNSTEGRTHLVPLIEGEK